MNRRQVLSLAPAALLVPATFVQAQGRGQYPTVHRVLEKAAELAARVIDPLIVGVPILEDRPTGLRMQLYSGHITDWYETMFYLTDKELVSFLEEGRCVTVIEAIKALAWNTRDVAKLRFTSGTQGWSATENPLAMYTAHFNNTYVRASAERCLMNIRYSLDIRGGR